MCFGCGKDEKGSGELPYSTLEEWAKGMVQGHRKKGSGNPELRFHGADETKPKEWFEVSNVLRAYGEDEMNFDEWVEVPSNGVFAMTKQIFCSDNVYAKELVKKYGIITVNTKCDDQQGGEE